MVMVRRRGAQAAHLHALGRVGVFQFGDGGPGEVVDADLDAPDAGIAAEPFVIGEISEGELRYLHRRREDERDLGPHPACLSIPGVVGVVVDEGAAREVRQFRGAVHPDGLESQHFQHRRRGRSGFRGRSGSNSPVVSPAVVTPSGTEVPGDCEPPRRKRSQPPPTTSTTTAAPRAIGHPRRCSPPARPEATAMRPSRGGSGAAAIRPANSPLMCWSSGSLMPVPPEAGPGRGPGGDVPNPQRSPESTPPPRPPGPPNRSARLPRVAARRADPRPPALPDQEAAEPPERAKRPGAPERDRRQGRTVMGSSVVEDTAIEVRTMFRDLRPASHANARTTASITTSGASSGPTSPVAKRTNSVA